MECPQINASDLKLQHPFCMMVAGPTMCGKTRWVQNMIENNQDIIQPCPTRIIWSYKCWQPAYESVAKQNDVRFVRGINDKMINGSQQPTLLIIDDQMSDVDDRVVDWFTRGCHHDNVSLVYITQNLFFQDKRFRTASLNCHYLVLFKNPRDTTQISHLARQMYDGKKAKAMVAAFEDATNTPYGTLLVDLKPQTADHLRLRSKIFPHEGEELVNGFRSSVYYSI